MAVFCTGYKVLNLQVLLCLSEERLCRRGCFLRLDMTAQLTENYEPTKLANLLPYDLSIKKVCVCVCVWEGGRIFVLVLSHMHSLYVQLIASSLYVSNHTDASQTAVIYVPLYVFQ